MQVKIHVKKIAVDVDNFPNYSEKRYQMICQIQGFLKEGCSYREIVRRMGVGRNTIAKYRNGNPMELSMYGGEAKQIRSILRFYSTVFKIWVEQKQDS